MNDSVGSFIFKDDLRIESNLDNENENTLSVLLDKTREEILTMNLPGVEPRGICRSKPRCDKMK